MNIYTVVCTKYIQNMCTIFPLNFVVFVIIDMIYVYIKTPCNRLMIFMQYNII